MPTAFPWNEIRSRVAARFALLAIMLAVMALSTGCTSWLPSNWRDPTGVFRTQSPEEEDDVSRERPRLVGDIAVVGNTQRFKAEGYGLVTGLRNTGSDVPIGEVRKLMITELGKRKIDNPQQLLASKSTAVVALRTFIRPAIDKGETLDVEVRSLDNTETTSLRGGKLLTATLSEMQFFGTHRFDGRDWALAQGPILIDPSASITDDKAEVRRGVILGGATAVRSRDLVLVMKPEHQSVFNVARIERAINARFSYIDAGRKVGVATGKTNDHLVLKVPQRYKNNLQHYVQVVQSVALAESPRQHAQRMTMLEKQLHDAVTAEDAALQLEAIGPEAIEILAKGLKSPEGEVRAFSGMALAYMGDLRGVMGVGRPLAEIAEQEPAFRPHALAALSVMDDFESYDLLKELLNASSARTRYGAFYMLTIRGETFSFDRNDPEIRGVELGDDFRFHYHVLDTTGPPMIHISKSRRPEVVLFGATQRLSLPVQLDAGPHILVTTTPDRRLKVSRFSARDSGDRHEIVSPTVDDMIRAIVKLGGSYPDVVQALQQASDAEKLGESRFVVDALPDGSETYKRGMAGDDDYVDEYVDDEESEQESSRFGWLRPPRLGWLNPFGSSTH